MSDRLTTEDFKKIFENINVEGFNYDHVSQRMNLPHGGWNIDDSSIWNNPSWTCLFYPLLLQMIKRGINKHCTVNYRIDMLGINLFIIDNKLNSSVGSHYDNNEGLEKSIKQILDTI